MVNVSILRKGHIMADVGFNSCLFGGRSKRSVQATNLPVCFDVIGTFFSHKNIKNVPTPVLDKERRHILTYSFKMVLYLKRAMLGGVGMDKDSIDILVGLSITNQDGVNVKSLDEGV